MTNRTITSLAIRIAGLYLFTKIFDHYASYILSTFYSSTFTSLSEVLEKPLEKFYVTSMFLMLTNIFIALFLIIKAEWISTKLIKSDSEIATNFTLKSFCNAVFISIGIIWLAKVLYLMPDFIDYSGKVIASMIWEADVEIPKFSGLRYIIRLIIALFLVFKANKISNWVTKKI